MKIKALHITILIVLIADLLLPFLLAIPYKGYSHKNMAMSALGAKPSPLRFLYNAWTILSGCMFIVFGFVMYRHYDGNHKGLCIAIGVLFALYGLGCEIISGFFPVGENASVKTLSSTIHGIGSVIGFMALLFVPLLLGIVQSKSKESICGIVSIIFFILSFIAFAFFVISDKPSFANTVFSYEGLWQRVAMYMMYIPLIIFTLKLLIKKNA